MKLETLNYIYTLLKAEEANRHEAYDIAKRQFCEYEDSYLSGDTVTNKQTYDNYEDEMHTAWQQWGDSQRALREFEDTDW